MVQCLRPHGCHGGTIGPGAWLDACGGVPLGMAVEGGAVGALVAVGTSTAFCGVAVCVIMWSGASGCSVGSAR